MLQDFNHAKTGLKPLGAKSILNGIDIDKVFAIKTKAGIVHKANLNSPKITKENGKILAKYTVVMVLPSVDVAEYGLFDSATNTFFYSALISDTAMLSQGVHRIDYSLEKYTPKNINYNPGAIEYGNTLKFINQSISDYDNAFLAGLKVDTNVDIYLQDAKYTNITDTQQKIAISPPTSFDDDLHINPPPEPINRLITVLPHESIDEFSSGGYNHFSKKITLDLSDLSFNDNISSIVVKTTFGDFLLYFTSSCYFNAQIQNSGLQPYYFNGMYKSSHRELKITLVFTLGCES